MHSTGYIYPVHHIVEFAYRITPTGLNYLHRIYPQDIQKYVLWVYPVEKFLNILYIVYPVGNLSFTDESHTHTHTHAHTHTRTHAHTHTQSHE